MADFQYYNIASTTLDGLYIVLNDTTYDLPSVDTGYGLPDHPARTSVTTAVATIYLPDPTTYQVGTSSVDVDLVSKNYPVSGKVYISAEDLGLTAGSKIPDGAYAIEVTIGYTFTDGGGSEVIGTSTAPEVRVMLDFYANCCIDGQKAKKASCSCKTISASNMKLFLAYMGLDSIPYLLSSCDPPKDEEAVNILANAKETCNFLINCKNCGC